MKGWVGLVGWPIADGLQVERGTGKDRRSTTEPHSQLSNYFYLYTCKIITTFSLHVNISQSFSMITTFKITDNIWRPIGLSTHLANMSHAVDKLHQVHSEKYATFKVFCHSVLLARRQSPHTLNRRSAYTCDAGAEIRSMETLDRSGYSALQAYQNSIALQSRTVSEHISAA